MWFWILVGVCMAYIVIDIVNDPEFKEKIKNVEE